MRTTETSFVSRDKGTKLTPISRRNVTIDKIDYALANETVRQSEKSDFTTQLERQQKEM
jgi:hypothetical protein